MADQDSPTFDRVLITGAGSGIGRETARRLASTGRRLFVTTRDQDKLNALVDEIDPAGAEAIDLTQPRAAETLVANAVEQLGGLDAVVHCAGVGLIKPVLQTTDAEFSRLLNVNLRVTFLVAQAAAKVMAENKRGRFITFPGILGKAVMKNASAYIASKFGVTGLIRAFAQEFQRQGVQFTLFHFGGVDTPFWDDLGMAVKRDLMIPVATAADHVVAALDAPGHLVVNEVVLQPESHQMG